MNKQTILDAYEYCITKSSLTLTEENLARKALLDINITGVISSESFCTILEQVPLLPQLVCKTLNQTVAELRYDHSRGKLTLKRFNEALQLLKGEIE